MINIPGPDKLLLLAVIALVVLGPSRLPQAARTAGKWVQQLRKFTSRLQEEVSGAIGDPKDAISAAVGDLRNEVGNWREEMAGFRGSMTTAIPNTAAAARSTFGNGSRGNGNGSEPGNGSGAAPATPESYPAGTIYSADAPPAAPGALFGSGGLTGLPPAPDDPSLN